VIYNRLLNLSLCTIRCVICMIDFETDDKIKFLPCLHTFHQSCIDTWLLRSLICPSCMEPVDAGLLSTYDN
jgi:E3 ubiquitin-protein ligase RNF11